MILVWQPLNLGKSCIKPTCHHPPPHTVAVLRETHMLTENQTLQPHKRNYNLGALLLHKQELGSRQTGDAKRQQAEFRLEVSCFYLGAVGASHRGRLCIHSPGPALLIKTNEKLSATHFGQFKEPSCYQGSGETVSSVTFVTSKKVTFVTFLKEKVKLHPVNTQNILET